jgi:hypothetical protein
MMVSGSTVADFDSTLIRRGRKAVTFPEMAEFAATLEERPISQLLEELPEIARLSTAKFDMATTILRRRFSHESPVDQLQLRTFGYEIAERVDDTNVGRRIRKIFEPHQ